MDILTQTTYYTSLPKEYALVDSMVELLELMPKKRAYKKENLQFIDTDVLVYTHHSQRYYSRSLTTQVEAHILPLVRKGRVYMSRERKCSTDEITRRETLLMIEYLEKNLHIPSRETQLKLLREKLKP